MDLIFTIRSVNGRWGIDIVGPTGTIFPAEGNLRHLGYIAGVSTYVFTPGDTGQWVLPTEDVTVHCGASIVETMGIYSDYYVTVLLLGPEAVVEHHDNNRSEIRAYVRGVKQNVPAAVLAAAGLVKTEGEVIEITPPPPLEGALAAAFKATFKET